MLNISTFTFLHFNIANEYKIMKLKSIWRRYWPYRRNSQICIQIVVHGTVQLQQENTEQAPESHTIF